MLLSVIAGWPLPRSTTRSTLPLSYGIEPPFMPLPWLNAVPFAVLLTATSRDDKLWPEEHWIAAARAFPDRRFDARLAVRQRTRTPARSESPARFPAPLSRHR